MFIEKNEIITKNFRLTLLGSKMSIMAFARLNLKALKVKYLVIRVIRFGDILAKFFCNFSLVYLVFAKMGNSFCHWANFHSCKWPNIELTI